MRRKTFIICCLAVLTWCIPIAAFCQRAVRPETSTSGSRKYYLVQNATTKEYMFHDDHSSRLWSRASITTYTYITTTYPIDGYLFYLDEAEGGVKIGNKAVGEGSYLANTTAASNDLGNFTSSGSVWGLERSALNVTGWLVKDVSGGQYWCHDGALGTNYICLEDLGDYDKDTYIWRFIGFDELLAEAKANNMDVSAYSGLDGSQASDFQTLVGDIATAKSNSSVPPIADGEYLLINRRHNLYLDGQGTTLPAVGSPTQNAVWQLTTVGTARFLVNKAQNETVRVSDNSGHLASTDPTASFSIDPSVTDAMAVLITKSSDGDRRFVTLYHPVTNRYGTVHNLYFSLAEPDATVSARNSQGLSSDWGFVSVEEYLRSAGYWNQGIEEMPTYLTDLSTIDENAFYRLQNVARSYTYYEEDLPGYGGWLEDVDHLHIRADLGNTNAELATVQSEAGTSEFYCADKNMSHASALWQFVLVSKASGDVEQPTGVLATEHNIYVLRNANTGKYIKKDVTATDGKFFHQITTEKSEAQPFYITRLADGEFAFWEYSSTSSAGVDQSNGALAVEGTATGSRAGLTRSTTATANTTSSWLILPAPQIRLNFVTTASKNNSNDNWSTFYYPFDVVPQAADASELEIYAGAWIKDDVQIAMVRMDDVPAGNAVMVRSEADSAYVLNIYPANSGECTMTEENFEGSCWRGIVESEGNQYNGKPARYDNEWRNYWILSANRNKDVRLLHPAGDWLLPNRAYLDAVTTQSTPSQVSMFVYFFDDRVTSVRDVLRLLEGGEASRGREGLFDLQGRQVTGRPTPGIYVRDGRKVYIR